MGLLDDDNLGILGGAAQAVKAGIQGYQDAEDRQYNRRIMAAKMNAAQTEADRKKDDDDIEAARAGLRIARDPVTGRIKRDPVTGKADINQVPELYPLPKPMNPVQEEYYRTNTEVLKGKPTMDRNQIIKNAAEKGYKATFDEKGAVSFQIDPSLAPPMSEKDKAMIEEAHARRDEARAGRQAKMSEASSARTDKMAKAMRDSLDPNLGRAGNMGKNQARVDAADRVDALFRQFPDYNVPKGQTIELTSAIAGLINGGSAQSQHQIDSMTPSSLKGDVNGLVGWLTNDPRGREQQAFMKMMHETAIRERDVAQGQVKSAQIQRLTSHRALKLSDPALYNQILDSYGINPAEIDEKGRYKAGGGLINEGLLGKDKGLIQKPPGVPRGPIVIQPVPGVTLTPRQKGALDFIKTNPDDERTDLWIQKMRQEGIIR